MDTKCGNLDRHKVSGWIKYRMEATCGSYFFFSSFLIFFSAFFSFGVFVGSFLVAFLLSCPLLMMLPPIIEVLLCTHDVNVYPFYPLNIVMRFAPRACPTPPSRSSPGCAAGPHRSPSAPPHGRREAASARRAGWQSCRRRPRGSRWRPPPLPSPLHRRWI